MKIYISGKITGDPHYNAKFARAAADITDAGHTPINPALQPEGMSNADYMRISFAQLDSADAVAFLPGRSRRCRRACATDMSPRPT